MSNPELDTAGVGTSIRSSLLPGRIVDGSLVRRPVLLFNASYGINAFSDASRQEAGYLFLQWTGGARIHSWLASKPGFHDPLHAYSLSDQLVQDAYQPQPTEELARIIPRAAPPITIHGGTLYRDILSEELQNVLTGRQNPEEAAAALERRWNDLTEQLGVDRQAQAIKPFLAAFPTVTDTPA